MSTFTFKVIYHNENDFGSLVKIDGRIFSFTYIFYVYKEIELKDFANSTST